MKKKIISLLMATALMAACMVGCGTAAETEGPTAEFEAEKTTKEEAPAPETPAEDVDINVAALKGPTAMGMVKLMAESDNGETATNHYTFTIAAAPDEITPNLIQGNYDIAAVPANLASVLFNKTDGQMQVLAINTLGVLYIVENGETINSVEDLKGKTIYASGKGATPEYALNYMLSSNGIDPQKDVTIEYKSEHAECVSALVNDEDGVAMLPQPFATTALMQNENMRIALDMTKEWESAAKANGSSASLVTGVIVARKVFVDAHPEAVEIFLNQYENSIKYTNDNVEDASALIEKYDIIKAAVAQKAIPYCNITFIAGSDMKEKLGGYLEELYNQNPEAVGGQVPADEFYYIEK
ncbi:ABC transporter substrate-binding protein [Pseudobutyrivibrio xylanivorans]|uniref:NitT/TauT family transport system substrate-binding protein n=1 Tax=Pseudobutyrivibrio xylanivorans TaxID=185007 RepID=A0A1G5S1R8_PSEXY|nr:PhnD/SsuA/transferrin family substrate-binding protein [Pseudobutyrivibrio xylanivorans]SCZ80098.1 NitT/TauT family transport system substrate-binding protein [Pseudobutyrivibrio xylanivorans]